MKTCKKCNETKPEELFHWAKNGLRETVCKKCREARRVEFKFQNEEAFKKRHLEAVKRSQAKDMKKRNARAAVNNAIRMGKMSVQPCLICGKEGEAHHPDYDSPLQVVWLCKAHHHETHALARQIDRIARYGR